MIARDVAVAAGSVRVSGIGLLLLASAALSVVTLVAGYVIDPRSDGSHLTALWPLPLSVGLELLALHRLRGTQRAARLEHLMRDATARISNAAWFLTDPEALLVRARDESRLLLDDPSIEGSLRPLPRHRFVAELYSRDGRSVTTRGKFRALIIPRSNMVISTTVKFAAPASCAPVRMSTTPGIFFAADTSMLLMLA